MGKTETISTICAKDVENVLHFIREAEDAVVLAEDERKICEDRQQDILHDLELVDHTHNERGRMGKELTEIRRQRRTAKNACELLYPLCEWIANNGNAIKALQRVLGEMRKIEDKQKNRQYYRKADGKGEVIGGPAGSVRRKKSGA